MTFNDLTQKEKEAVVILIGRIDTSEFDAHLTTFAQTFNYNKALCIDGKEASLQEVALLFASSNMEQKVTIFNTELEFSVDHLGTAQIGLKVTDEKIMATDTTFLPTIIDMIQRIGFLVNAIESISKPIVLNFAAQYNYP